MQNPLAELQEYENLLEALKKGQGPIQATGTLDSQKVHLMYELKEDASYAVRFLSWALATVRHGTRLVFRRRIIRIWCPHSVCLRCV